MVLVIKKKQIIISLICVILIACISTMYGFLGSSLSASTAANPNTNWGLSFTSNDKAPIGNATPEFLKQYNAYYIGDTNQNKIYLSFDAGFENGYTAKILDVLKENDVKATFFLVGNYLKTAPDLVKRMVAEGHTVGNHTFNHPDMSKISDMDSFKKEMVSLEELFKEVTGKDLEKVYRPPQGKYKEDNLKMANELGYKTFFWSLAYVDWFTDKQPSREYALKKLERIHKGAVVLLHSTSKTNSEILDELIKKWKKEGYEFGELKTI